MTQQSVEIETMSIQDAKKITRRIVAGIEGVQEMVLEAFRGRVWVPLGYSSWTVYCETEIKNHRIDLPAVERQAVVADLARGQMSNRAIASALGVSDSTVRKDLHEIDPTARFRAVEEDRTAIGADGKRRSASHFLGQEPASDLASAAEPTRPAPIIWGAEEAAMRDRLESGEIVIVSMRRDSGQENLIRWATENDLLVRIDRKTVWGNPFELPDDGDRETVIRSYQDHYLPYKPSLLSNLESLRGKAHACWCYPLACHGDVLKDRAEE